MVSRSGVTLRGSMPLARFLQPRAVLAGERGSSFSTGASRRSPISWKPASASLPTLAGPDAVDEPTGLSAPEAPRASLLGRSRQKPRGLSMSRAILARNLLAEDKPDRDGDTELALDVACREARQHLGRRSHAVQSLGAGEVEKGLVDRERLDLRRELPHSSGAPRGRPRRISDMFGLTTTACGQALRAP